MSSSLAFPLLLAAAIGLGAFSFGSRPAAEADAYCGLSRGWSVPGGETVEEGAFLDEIAARAVVLLGERHDDIRHHRWQRDTLQALHQRRGDVIVGLEMFPRRVQPALDAWVRGELDEEAFLLESDWDNVWGFDPQLYMEIFRYARDNQLPMRALNVEASFTRAVGRQGFEATAPADREGVTKPAEPSPRYANGLSRIFRMHYFGASRNERRTLKNFIEAQLVWDRAMAQGIRDALDENPDALLVGLIGHGHLRHGDGVPHQLNDLGITDHATLLPWDSSSDCRELVAGLADAVYRVDGDGRAGSRGSI